VATFVSASPNLLAESEGREKQEKGRGWVKRGWSNNEGRARDGGWKGKIPHDTRRVAI